MRNLVATTQRSVLPCAQVSNVHQFCVDSDTPCVWVSADESLYCLERDALTNMAPLSGHMMSHDTVVAMECVPDLECVCLAISNGNVLIYQSLTSDLRCVGEVETGLSTMSWSPDQELIVLVTRDDKLVLMTMNFDPITETFLHPDDFGESQSVTVGWGKKETQFHGSQGKPKSQAASSKPVNTALSWDDKRTRVSWRGDGEYFVVSCIDPSTRARKIRVWNRMCVLQATSEALDGLGQALHWRPAGNLIASSQTKPHRQDIVFFERNGLQHGEFPLPQGAWLVQEVSWNNDSTVLAVWLRREHTPDNDHNTKVQLWTTGNYHWYLKQEVRVHPANKITPTGDLVGIIWDSIKSLRLHLITADGTYKCYNWRWCVDTDHTHSPENSTPVAVIDGNNILLTSFRHNVVPPPMAAYTLTLPTPVISVSFAPPPLQDSFIALLADSQVALYRPKQREERQLKESLKLVGVSSIAVECVRGVTWWKPDKLLVVGQKEGKDVIVVCTLFQGSEVKFTISCVATPPFPVYSLCVNPNSGSAVVQLTEGQRLLWIRWALKGEVPSLSLDPCEEVGLPADQMCEQIALALFNEKEYVVGLNSFSGTLFIGHTQVVTGCTSFAVHNEYLLLTTTSHVLRFISTASEPRALSKLSAYGGEMVRSVERGSRLVAAVPFDSRVVLQMPRGNLETVYPRALVLSSVRRALNRVDFRSAFLSMRKHRINLNLLHDHDPKLFFEHILQFVEQLNSVTFINLFLTELKEEDVSKTMYVSPVNSSCDTGEVHDLCQSTKVDSVCAAVRGALVAMGTDKYLLSIITTHVHETTPNLQAVLGILKELKAHSDTSDTAEEAIKYTLFLVDVNELYNVALGMYDFDLVLLVAEKSQKDPKEYLPFLNELQKLPTDYQRYRIDLHLQRYDKALHHVSKCGPDKFPECLALVKDHLLYPQALSVYTDHSSTEYKEIARSYGAHLRSKGRHREAGLILAQCGALNEALGSFERAGNWRQVFALSAQLQYSPTDRTALARRVANNLKSVKRHSEAAQVLLDYTGSVEEGVVTLLEGGCWEESLRVARHYSRVDLLESLVRPSLLETASSQLALVESLETTFTRHFSRLEVVRRLKRDKEKAILEGTYAVDERDADLFSDTSSVTAGRSGVSSLASSLLSKASGRSSKNRRKAEHKKHSLREGSAHEDKALMEALYELVITVDRLQDDILELLGMLVLFNFMDEGRALQVAFEQLLGRVKGRSKEIWSPENTSAVSNVTDLTGPAATVNSIVAAMQSTAKAGTTSGVSSFPVPQLRESINWKLDILS